MIIAGITGVFICWQSWETRKSAEAARDSARAALSGVEASVNADKALLLIRPDDEILGSDFVSFTWRVFNSGKTPAFILESTCAFEMFNSQRDIPEQPIYREPFVYHEDPILPGQEKDGDGISLKTHLTPKEISNKLKPGEGAMLFAFGRVKYRDIFRQDHETRFGFIFYSEQGRFDVGGPRKYNEYS